MIHLADLLATHWPEYVAQFGAAIPDEQCAAVRAIRRCRTPALGGEHWRCACGKEHFAHHSCNHRACPRCGRDDTAAWLAQPRARLLPGPYFLVTLTVPEQLRAPIRAAMRLWYGALLKEGAGALQDLAADTRHLSAELGLTAVLQTWTRDLRYHPHVHRLAPGDGLTFDPLRWVRVKDAQFLVPQVKRAARFKGRLKTWLKKEHPALFAQVPAKVWWMKWVADVRPVGTGEAALHYLAAYLCRPPLFESQFEACDDTGATWRYRENAARGGAVPRATVSGSKFLRRLLQHVLPKGFQRVRHFGWRAGAAKKKWARILALLDWRPCEVVKPAPMPPPVCPGCGKPMVLIGTRPRAVAAGRESSHGRREATRGARRGEKPPDSGQDGGRASRRTGSRVQRRLGTHSERSRGCGGGWRRQEVPAPAGGGTEKQKAREGTQAAGEFDGRVQPRMERTLRARTPQFQSITPSALRSFPILW